VSWPVFFAASWLFFCPLSAVAGDGAISAETPSVDDAAPDDADELTRLLNDLNVDNGFYHPADEDLLKYNVRSAAESRAGIKALEHVPEKERGEVARSLKKSMDLLNGVDPDGVYYFPEK